MGFALCDVLLFSAAHLPGARCTASGHRLSLLLSGDGALRALTGPRIGFGALATHGKSAAVTASLIGADFDFPADVGCDFAAQIALNLKVSFDEVPEGDQLTICEFVNPFVRANARGGQRLLSAGLADTVNICECDLGALFARKIDTYEASHLVGVSFR